MSLRQLDHPFGDEPYEDVPLAAAPLVRVLCQLRFEPLAVLTTPAAANAFTEALSSEYPYFESGTEFTTLISGGQVAQQANASPVWSLRSRDKASMVVLTNGSLALETASYAGRTRFCEEFTRIAEILRDVTRIPEFSRLGVRYTNRVTGNADIDAISRLIRPEISGISAIQPGGYAELVHSLSSAAFKVGEHETLLAQWGNLPPNSGFDPSISPVGTRSWVLDLDSFSESPIQPIKSELLDLALNLAEQAYRFFRWAVSFEFLERFGVGDA